MNPTTDTRQRQRKSLNPNDNKKTHTMMDTNEEMKRPSSHRHRSYRLNSSHVKLSHLDPELVTSDSDSESDELKIEEELARKRTKLQQIDKQIRLQKTTDAMKTTRPFLKAKKPSQMLKEERKEDLSHSKVESSVKNTQPFMTTLEKDVGVSSGEWSSTYNNRPLKETVNGILQQRWPDGVLATAKALSTPSDHPPSPNPVEKTHTSTLSEDDHPLKLRVKALMNRHCYSGSLDSHGEVPVVKAPPSCESPSTTVTENNLVVKGFQRFLSVLNNGVDIEMLTKMVNDNHERPLTGQELLHSQTRVVKEKSDVCKIESQQLQRGAGQRDRRSCSKERKTKLLNQDLSNGGRKRNIQPEEKSSQGDDGGSRHSGSSRRSRSPPVVEEKKPKLVQHQEDLQNILKTIGFSLDADDMCKLEERTQERLYGIKHDTKQRLDSSGVSKRIQQHVQSDKSHSLSSTSISVSTISSPSCNQHSLSKTDMDSREQTQRSEYLHFRQGSREGGSERDVDKDKNRIASRDGSSGHHQYPENQEYLVTYPNAACAIPMYNSDAPSYTSVQHSENTAYHSDTSNCASLNYGSNDIPPSSSYPPGFCNYSMTPSCPSDTGALFDLNYPHSQPPAPCNTALGHSYFNTDLSLSEGQTGQRSGSHYLHIINTEKPRGAQNKVRQRGNNHNLSLGEAQTEQQPAIKVKFQREEKKMTKQKQGLREGQRSIQRQLLEVELLTEEEINANPTKKEQNPNLSLSEGQTGHQSDLCHLHSINTIQHSESTASHSDTSNSASLTAGSNDIPPSTSCPPGFCNSINPVWTSADTKAFLSKVCSQKQLPLIINPIKWFMKDLWFVRKSIASVKSDPVIMNNSKEQQKILEKLAEREQDILKRLARIGHKRSKMEIKRQMEMAKDKKALQKQLDVVRNSIDGVNCDPLINSEEKQKKLEKLAGAEQDILKKLGQNPDLSLSEGQTGQRSAVNTVTKAKFQKEEKKMAELKEGQKESKISIQGQQLEVELPTEEIINANLTEKEQNSDLSLSEGQTGHQSDLCHLHSINTIQHSESTASHSDTSNSASLTAGSNVIPPSSSCPSGFCNSINPVWTSADTEAFLVKTCPQKKTSLRIHPREWFSNDLRFVRRTIARVKSDPVIMNNSEEHQKILENLAEREQDILKRLEQIPSKRQEKDLQRSLKFVRNSIDGVNCDPLINSEEKKKKLEKLAGAEQDILKKLGQNPDLSLSEGQTEQRSAVNTVTKAKFQKEEKKMAEQKEGQKESKISIQGQQLEVELPTEEIINANLTEKEQNSDLSLSEGQTGHQSDLRHLHSINTIQHSESISSHSDTSNSASLTAGSNVIPPSSSCPPGFCNSINPVWTSADTEAFLGKVRSQKKDLTFVRKTIAHVKSDPVIMNNSKEQQKILEKLAEREQDILKRLASTGQKRSKMEIKRQMLNAKGKKALLKRLEQNPDLSLSERQTGHPSDPFHLHSGYTPPLRHVSFTTCLHYDTNPIFNPYPELNPYGSVATPTIRNQFRSGDMSEWRATPFHSINTIQHERHYCAQESTASHSDSRNSASLTAGSYDIQPSTSCPPGFCNSMNPVWTSADTEAFIVKFCSPKKTNNKKLLMDDLRFVRKTISRVKSDPVIMSNSKEQQKIFKKLAEREKDILKRLASIGHERSKMEIKRQMEMAKDKKALQKQLDVVRNSIAGVNSDHLMNSEEKQKKLEKLAGVEQYFLNRLSNY